MQERITTSLTSVLAVGAIMLAVASPVWAGKGNADNPGIAPPQSSAHGATYGEWAVKWWQWALGIPAAQNPVADTTGQFAAVGQAGPVWFLAGTFGGDAERTVAVPPGKALFMPVYNWIFGAGVFDCDPSNPGVPCDVPTLQQSAAHNTTSAQLLEAWVDGVAVNNLRSYRGTSPGAFSIVLPAENVLGLDAGLYYPQVADGYWLLLSPLSAGKHTIVVHVVPDSSLGTAFTVTYHLTITNS